MRPSATKRARSFPEGETGSAAQVCGHETQHGSQCLGGRWRDGRDNVEPGREEKRGGRREILSGAQVAAGEKPYGRRTSRPVLMRSVPGVASVVCVVEATEPVRAPCYRISAIWTALRAAPLRIWSPVSQSVQLWSSARSLRMRPTKTSSLPADSRGMG